MRTTTFRNKLSYYARFTILFAITALIIYAPFLLFKKALVWEHDSYTQHLKAMVFISRWYRQSLRALLTGHWREISTYSFTLGYGSDALSALAYYGVGDPFYLLSALVPAKYIYLFYCILIPVKNYCSGLVFSALCRFRWPGKEHDNGCLAGSLLYTFCGFALITCVGQPIFLNVLILFPLVLLGIEKVRDGRKPWLFIIAIMLSSVSNFYFLLSVVIMAVLYACFRYFPIEKGQLGRRFAQIGTMFAAGTVGVAMGGVIILPMLLTVFGNKRVSLDNTIGILYDLRTCRMLPVSFLACYEVQYGALCYAGTALLCVFLLFSAKGYLKLRLQFLLYTALLFIPAFGYLTNGFSYPINRWCWAYSALIGMITAELWPRLFELTALQKKVMAAGITVYFFISLLLVYEIEFNLLAAVVLTCLTLLHLLLSQREQYFAGSADGAVPAADSAQPEEGVQPETARSERRRARGFRRAQRGVLYLTIAGICVNGIYMNYPVLGERLETYRDLASLAPSWEGLGASPANNRHMWINDSRQVASAIGHDTTKFARFSNTEPGYWYQNTSILHGISSTQSFWSVNSPYILEYLDALAVSDVNNNAWQFTNLDNRAILNELASVSCLYCMHPEKLPAGYADTPLDTSTANSVYPNENPLPLGYTYRRTVSREQFDALSPAQRQALLMTHAVTETAAGLQDPATAAQLAEGLACKEVPFTAASLSDDVVQTDDNTFVVTDAGAEVELSFDPLAGGECYLYLKNIQFRKTNDLEIFSDDPAFDPNNLYTPGKWEKISPYDRYRIRREIFDALPLKNIKIEADFRNGTDIVTQNEVNYILPDNEQFYSGRQDFLLNSYTIRKGIDSIVVRFPATGIYHFDELAVISEPLTSYAEDVSALAAESLENVEIHQNPSSFVSTGVTGEITVSENKLLCLTIPYSEGWKAYVDGTPAILENVNVMFCGLWLTPGHHTIELRYETPGLLYGICITAAGILLFLLWAALSARSGGRRRKKAERPAEESAGESSAGIEPGAGSDVLSGPGAAAAGAASDSDTAGVD